ncbi:MAG: hypothetical protein JWN14_2230 [Chthonomonadales bacterium]|nr:hypothetical protein [Chthonomonadales bacterium]
MRPPENEHSRYGLFAAKFRRLRGSLALLLLIAMIGIVIFRQQCSPELLEVSHPILHPGRGDDDTFVWEGIEDLIVVRERYSITRNHVTTNAQSPLSSAPDRLLNRERPVTHDIGNLEVRKSPDGKWLEWKPHWGCTYLLSLVGPEHLPYTEDPDVEARQFVWFADSKRYAVFSFEPFSSKDASLAVRGRETFANVYLADLRKPGKRRSLPVTPAGLMDRNDVLASVGLDHQILPAASDSRRAAAKAVSTLTLYQCVFGKTAELQKCADIPISTGARIDEAALTSDGKRLAWIEDTETRSPVRSFLHRLIPAIKETPNATASLWVSRIDGTAKRESGFVTAPHKSDVLALQWLPDNRHLSFVYGDTLYIVKGK